MSPLRITYLVLTIIGSILPMYYLVGWFNENTWSLAAMVDAWHVNDAIPATFFIGVSCGLPLYLLLRSRQLG